MSVIVSVRVKMEDWQRHHIKENLVELLRLTSCDHVLIAFFEQHDIISIAEKQDLVSKYFDIHLIKQVLYWQIIYES